MKKNKNCWLIFISSQYKVKWLNELKQGRHYYYALVVVVRAEKQQ